MSILLIGIHGKPKAGKDIIADHIIDHYAFTKYGPSYPVKKAAAAMFDVDIKNFYNVDRKEMVDPFWGISYREMAQKVGKESSRDIFGEDIWLRHVSKMMRTIEEQNEVYIAKGFPQHCVLGIIMADVRYPNEAQWVRDQGGKMIFVFRPDAARGYIANAGHPAEAGFPPTAEDYVIYNESTIEVLKGQVDVLMQSYIWEMELTNENKNRTPEISSGEVE